MPFNAVNVYYVYMRLSIFLLTSYVFQSVSAMRNSNLIDSINKHHDEQRKQAKEDQDAAEEAERLKKLEKRSKASPSLNVMI